MELPKLWVQFLEDVNPKTHKALQEQWDPFITLVCELRKKSSSVDPKLDEMCDHIGKHYQSFYLWSGGFTGLPKSTEWEPGCKFYNWNLQSLYKYYDLKRDPNDLSTIQAMLVEADNHLKKEFETHLRLYLGHFNQGYTV